MARFSVLVSLPRRVAFKWVVQNGLRIFILGISLGGCVSLDPNDSLSNSADGFSNQDPFESFNRGVYEFNVDFDEAIGEPVAASYVKYVPLPVRRSVTNFFYNLWEPSFIINALLQGKFHKAASSSVRFLFNSTVGILGLFDFAARLDVPRQEEDLGQTLAVWGFKDGPYLMLPFIGPANVRDTVGLTVEFFSTDLVPILFEGETRLVIGGVRLVDLRASVLGLEEALKFQVDPYVFLRESYRQSRLIQINDGAPSVGVEDDPFEDELFAE
jgi:phospholipid-binding lipoprotein MlaA